MRKAGYLILGLFGILLIDFMVFNRQQVTVDLFPLPYAVDLPLAFVAIGGFLVGLGAAWVFGLRRRVKSYSRRRKAEDSAKALEREVRELEQSAESESSSVKPRLSGPQGAKDAPE